ncbi:MAG: RNA polymerase sigma factor [Planctomycetota bacterium]|nr:RNA polymerase sigma factor [Planctomycetota bacterium]
MDAKLIERAKQGDEEAFRELLLKQIPSLEAMIQAKLNPANRAVVDVDDILQESLVAIHRSLPSGEFEDEVSFNAWCRRITENRLLDAVRQQSRKKRGGDRRRIVDKSSQDERVMDAIPAKGTRASVRVRREEAAQEVNQAIGELPTAQREATKLKYHDGRSNQSIAIILEKSTQAVEGLLKRAKKQLFGLLGGGEDQKKNE